MTVSSAKGYKNPMSPAPKFVNLDAFQKLDEADRTAEGNTGDANSKYDANGNVQGTASFHPAKNGRKSSSTIEPGKTKNGVMIKKFVKGSPVGNTRTRSVVKKKKPPKTESSRVQTNFKSRTGTESSAVASLVKPDPAGIPFEALSPKFIHNNKVYADRSNQSSPGALRCEASRTANIVDSHDFMLQRPFGPGGDCQNLTKPSLSTNSGYDRDIFPNEAKTDKLDKVDKVNKGLKCQEEAFRKPASEEDDSSGVSYYFPEFDTSLGMSEECGDYNINIDSNFNSQDVHDSKKNHEDNGIDEYDTHVISSTNRRMLPKIPFLDPLALFSNRVPPTYNMMMTTKLAPVDPYFETSSDTPVIMSSYIKEPLCSVQPLTEHLTEHEGEPDYQQSPPQAYAYRYFEPWHYYADFRNAIINPHHNLEGHEQVTVPEQFLYPVRYNPNQYSTTTYQQQSPFYSSNLVPHKLSPGNLKNNPFLNYEWEDVEAAAGVNNIHSPSSQYSKYFYNQNYGFNEAAATDNNICTDKGSKTNLLDILIQDSNVQAPTNLNQNSNNSNITLRDDDDKGVSVDSVIANTLKMTLNQPENTAVNSSNLRSNGSINNSTMDMFPLCGPKFKDISTICTQEYDGASFNNTDEEIKLLANSIRKNGLVVSTIDSQSTHTHTNGTSRKYYDVPGRRGHDEEIEPSTQPLLPPNNGQVSSIDKIYESLPANRCCSTTQNSISNMNSTVNGIPDGMKPKVKEDMDSVLIEGVLFRASYLGSTHIYLSQWSKKRHSRTLQAREAVTQVKSIDGDNQPKTDVDLFISTEKIMVLNTNLQEIMMDHPLNTISYIADIGDVVVIMVKRTIETLPSSLHINEANIVVKTELNGISNGNECSDKDNDSSDLNKEPESVKPDDKMICHVFESDEAQLIAQSIGQAFQIAYVEFLKAKGILKSDGKIANLNNGLSGFFGPNLDYQDVLNSQEVFGEELDLFSNKEAQKEIVIPKRKNEPLGIAIVESGWGSIIPTVIIATLNPGSPATRGKRLNIGDRIISINNDSLVGLPLETCQIKIKAAQKESIVKLKVINCSPVVEVRIKRPDSKFQLGFSVQNGTICSLLRGGIAERGGVRVGHRIIEINGESMVAVPHERIVKILSTTIGEIHMKTMPTSIYRLLTGQETPNFI